MHANQKVIEGFYEAFSRRDAKTMAQCYADDVRFSDPVFPELVGNEARSMWEMLCEQARDFSVEAFDIGADEHEGRAKWVARYTFTTTGRSVENHVNAEFHFADGKIVRHTDDFDVWRWSRMALGAPGVLLGWSPVLRHLVRRTAAKQLARYRAKHG